jgi:hypothetical protein
MIQVFQHPKHYWLTIPDGEIEPAAKAYARLLGGFPRRRIADQITIDLPNRGSQLTLDEWEHETDSPPDDDVILVDDIINTLRSTPDDFKLLAAPANSRIGKQAIIADHWNHTITLLQVDWDAFEKLLEITP